MNSINIGYNYNVVNHTQGIFGLTSIIGGIWHDLKSTNRKMYSCFHSKNFIYFLLEAEYRRNIRDYDATKKLDDFSKVISSVDLDNFQSEEKLIDFQYDVCMKIK